MDVRNANWTELLSEEDLAFLKRFLLCSGSLKDLAKAYDVSYPTVRQRLDRLVEKVKVMDQFQSADAFERMLRGMLSDGTISLEAFKRLLAGHRQFGGDSAPAETTKSLV